MQINEVITKVDLSKRAVKYYEEQGLLVVVKDANGYRNYSEENIITLKKISVYRKLGIGIKDIKELLDGNNRELLENIYHEKAEALERQSEELEALRRFIQKGDVDAIYQVVDYKTIGEAMRDMFPGYYGYYFMNHFMPYLQIQIKTPEQEQAYKNIIQFWDNADIKLPLMMKIIGWINFYLMPKESMQVMADRADEQIKRYIQMSEDDYEKFKKEIASSAKIKNSFFFKYHPAFISQRKFMKQLQDKGYNDIFIPNMKALSPKYKEYHDALMRANDRVCADLGLYYDSNYNLVVKQ